jgi:hypothetical protein
MDLAAFDYELPGELIAQEPLADRAGARMLLAAKVADRADVVIPFACRRNEVLCSVVLRWFPTVFTHPAQRTSCRDFSQSLHVLKPECHNTDIRQQPNRYCHPPEVEDLRAERRPPEKSLTLIADLHAGAYPPVCRGWHELKTPFVRWASRQHDTLCIS